MFLVSQGNMYDGNMYDEDFFDAPDLGSGLLDEPDDQTFKRARDDLFEDANPSDLKMPTSMGSPARETAADVDVEEAPTATAPGSCGTPRPDDRQTLFFPFPIRLESKELFTKADRERVYNYLRGQVGNDTLLYTIVHCMLRRWVYVLPTEKGKGAGPGLILWDPLYEYTHALCRNGDNVEAMVGVLRRNILDTETQPFVFFIGTTRANTLLNLGIFDNNFKYNLRSLQNEATDNGKTKKYTLQQSKMSRTNNAVDDAIWTLGEDPVIETFLESYQTDAGTCRNLLNAFKKPTREGRICNLEGSWLVKGRKSESNDEYRERFIEMAADLAKALVADPARLLVYRRRVDEVREWTGNNEGYCDGAPRASKKAVARQQPEMEEVAQAPGRKRRTEPSVDCVRVMQAVQEGEDALDEDGRSREPATQVDMPLSRLLGHRFVSPAFPEPEHVDLVLQLLWNCAKNYDYRNAPGNFIESYLTKHYGHEYSVAGLQIKDRWQNLQKE